MTKQYSKLETLNHIANRMDMVVKIATRDGYRGFNISYVSSNGFPGLELRHADFNGALRFLCNHLQGASDNRPSPNEIPGEAIGLKI